MTLSRIDLSTEPIYGLCGTDPTRKFEYLQDDGNVLFCLKFSIGNNASQSSTNYTRFYFRTQVDLYTHIVLSPNKTCTMKDCGRHSWIAGRDVTVQFEAGNRTTSSMFARVYDDDDKEWIFTQLSLVITLDEGKVDKVEWDTGCYGCEEAHCIEGNCGISASDCEAKSHNCDFSVYISWYGTDANGHYLLSAGQRLSRFQSSSAKSYYDYVKKELDTSMNFHIDLDI
eukprot:207730_1